jgi:hypothetical protein
MFIYTELTFTGTGVESLNKKIAIATVSSGTF